MRKKGWLILQTIRYLKPIQIGYQLYYKLLGKLAKHPLNLQVASPHNPTFLTYRNQPDNQAYVGFNTFRLLNISHSFSNSIDWEYMAYGKLWQYNLCYFDYLHDNRLDKEEGLRLMHDFLQQEERLRSAHEPYPTSLRLINWIRFISQHQIRDARLNNAIFAQVKHLQQRLEYHLLANHLLENAFALLHTSYFLQDELLGKKAKRLLIKELDEQILPDGGHYELSPMYHQIILYRVLEAIDLLQNNRKGENADLMALLESKAAIMVGWLQQMTFANGDIPLLNDAAFGIAPTTSELKQMATALGVKAIEKPLKQSGYRAFRYSDYEAVIDIGGIQPAYQPGHAHADLFNIVLYHCGQPLLVDTGVSTYQINAQRAIERATISHNTISVNEQNESQVWSGFRVGRRATPQLLTDQPTEVAATHDGFKELGVICGRKFLFSEQGIEIHDTITPTPSESQQTRTSYFHFHPACRISLEQNTLTISGHATFTFTNATKIELATYKLAEGFNSQQEAVKAVVKFNQELHTTIRFSS